jgi:hypothetical protein
MGNSARRIFSLKEGAGMPRRGRRKRNSLMPFYMATSTTLVCAFVKTQNYRVKINSLDLETKKESWVRCYG